MTTIITIVVVALVFFVTVCIVAFMVWKREAEMRTDSIKAIEYNVEEMLHELTGDSSRGTRNRSRREEFRKDYHEPQHETNDRVKREVNREETHDDPVRSVQAVQKEPQDQSQWIRNENDDERITVFDPAVVQYTSFGRGADSMERDGRHGLRWKEIQQMPEEETHQEPTHQQEPVPETILSPEPEPTPEPEPIWESEPTPEPEPTWEPEPEFVEETQQIQDAEPKLIEEPQGIQDAEPEPMPAYDEINDEPEQEIYESIDDLLRDYISEPHSAEEDEEIAETHDSEPVKPGYDVGKSGRKYTAAELETLIKE